ncbi:hypothetical protein KCH_73670 [Kitasatospora cheerisanensis KCTC 2395]|uniref:Uncharacterized protein n=1 Tax=Kitasatospora cheerisanensis KCTC 2395 TaxID=1348663 RepID=A0A066YI87_9ACTN|nr:hypothetical protein KCH_73670 [Kitasatospora cheerisanensis KCTC 2395]
MQVGGGAGTAKTPRGARGLRRGWWFAEPVGFGGGQVVRGRLRGFAVGADCSGQLWL